MTGAGRWDLAWPDGQATSDLLGDHAAARYRHFRRFVEAQDKDTLDHALFGLLLSAESLRDELRSYDEAPTMVKLAQTGYYARQLRRMHGLLDSATATYPVNESSELKDWESALEREREGRVTRYRELLRDFEHQSELAQSDDDQGGLAAELASEEQQEEALVLLMTGVDKYADLLTDDEIELSKLSFDVIVRATGMIVMTPPPWFVTPFEFAGTYGLSRWGNDLLRPDQDKERFIETASTWFELNHPHMAKFLGACHVDQRPFFAHEKVRSLKEYASEVDDRRAVWTRLHEVALALQYLHERHLVCGKLDVNNIYCAYFEDKAVLLGIDLSALDGKKEGAKTTETHLKGISPPLPSVASDMRALALCILDIIREIVEPSEGVKPNQVEKGRGDKTMEVRVRQLPTKRPYFLSKAEWTLLVQMCGDGSEGNIGMLHVIKSLAEFGEPDSKDSLNGSNNLAIELKAADKSLELGQIVVPGLRKSIDDVLATCTSMVDSDRQASQVYERLVNVRDQMKQAMLQSDVSSGLSQYCGLMTRFYSFLGQKNRVDASSVLAMTRKGPAGIFTLHSDIDRFIELHALSSADLVHSWKLNWQNKSPPATADLMHLASHAITDIQESDEEAAFLEFELRFRSGTAVSAPHADCNDHHSQRTSTLPQWFLPSYEVEFRSANAFSEGSFGSVHHGKWFDTRVVVKRVFIDDENRAAIQAQMYREADIWFKLNHINVVEMYGACHVGQPFFVCEYASGGDLMTYLEQHDRDPYLIWYCLLNAALGLQYLHDAGVVHSDLKANNILVGSDGVAKLADFGLSVSSRDSDESEAGGALGAYRWKAPECIPSRSGPGKSATFASDVYSFAMCMIEAVSGEFPWGSVPDGAVSFHVKRGRLPPRPIEMSDAEWNLIERMCCLDPKRRTTIDAVVVHLSSLVDRLDMDKHEMAQGQKIVDDGKGSDGSYKNHIVSRGGALLPLLALVKSRNAVLSKFASRHLETVQINRGKKKSNQQEIDGIVELLSSANKAEVLWAITAVTNLAKDIVDNEWSIVAGGGATRLISMLQSTDEDLRSKAVRAMKTIACNDNNKVALARAGVIPLLVELLRTGINDQKADAAAALMELAEGDSIDGDIMHAGAVPPLVMLLRDGNDREKEEAAKALVKLSIDDNHLVAVGKSGAIPLLVSLLREGTDSQKIHALDALWFLSDDYDNNVTVVESGAIPLVMPMLESDNDDLKDSAIDLITQITEDEDHIDTVVEAGAIPLLMSLLRDGNDDHQKHAAKALCHIGDSEEAVQTMIDTGVISELMSLLNSGDTRQKASAARVFKNIAEHDEHSEAIVSAGVIPVLFKLLEDGDFDEFVSDALLCMTKCEVLADEMIKLGAIPMFVALLRDGNDEQKKFAADAFAGLADHDAHWDAVIQAGIITNLVRLVRDGDDDQKKNAADALGHIARSAKAVQTTIEEGVIPALMSLLNNGDSGQRASAARAFGYIAKHNKYSEAIVSAGIIPVLIELMKESGFDESVLDALLCMAKCEDLADEIVKFGAISIFANLVRDGSDIQKRFAVGAFENLVDHDTHKGAAIRDFIISNLVCLVRDGDDGQKEDAAEALGRIANTAKAAVAIVDADVIPALKSLLDNGNSGQKSSAAHALGYIVEHNEHSEAIVSAGVIPVLIELMEDSDFDECASYPLMYMAKYEELADEIVKFGAIPSFVTLLRDGNDDQKIYIAEAFARLANHDAHRDTVIQAGILSDLVRLVRDGDESQKENAAGALGNIAESTEGAKAVFDANAIPALVALLRVSDDADQENAVGALWNLACYSNEARLQLIKKENVALLVALVESGEDEVRALATGVLGCIGVDETTKSAIAEGGGIDVLLEAIDDEDVDEEEGLMALLSLSKDSVAVCSSVLSEDNADILAALAKSEDKSVKRLAGEILKQARGKKSGR